MSLSVLTVLAAFTGFADQLDVTKLPITLELATATPTIKQGESPKVTVTLVNRSNQDLTLVQPGDGSECGWRTPIVQWLINGEVPRGTNGRCGNINSLTASEVVTLKPGQRLTMNAWVGGPSLAGPGKYKVQLRYSNVPDLKWAGLAKHDEAAMQRVRASTRVKADSNAVEIEVKQK